MEAAAAVEVELRRLRRALDDIERGVNGWETPVLMQHVRDAQWHAVALARALERYLVRGA